MDKFRETVYERSCKKVTKRLENLELPVPAAAGHLFSFQKVGFYEFFHKTYKAEHHILHLMRHANSQSWVVRAEKVSLEYNVLRKEIRDILKDNRDDYKQPWDNQ